MSVKDRAILEAHVPMPTEEALFFPAQPPIPRLAAADGRPCLCSAPSCSHWLGRGQWRAASRALLIITGAGCPNVDEMRCPRSLSEWCTTGSPKP